MKYNIGYCESGLFSNRVIIPSYDEDGKLNFFVGRDIYESPMKYKNSSTTKDVVGFELFINWNEPIVLCEVLLTNSKEKLYSSVWKTNT